MCAVFVRAVCEISLIFLEFVQRDKYQNTKLTGGTAGAGRGGRGAGSPREESSGLCVPISLQSPLSAPQRVYVQNSTGNTVLFDVHTT